MCRRPSSQTPRRDRSSTKTVADLEKALSAPNDSLILSQKSGLIMLLDQELYEFMLMRRGARGAASPP
jgi:hypothetical protein